MEEKKKIHVEDALFICLSVLFFFFLGDDRKSWFFFFPLGILQFTP